MEGDNDKFRLRWEHHQRTLIGVFDTLLETGTLVDCTLAAEGQHIKAHKVMLSACSPYFQELLSQYYEKHPIVVLKDVKFQELKSMISYMYKGEVNIPQAQLGGFLRAAESLQIKGLTGGGGNEGDTASTAPTTVPTTAPIATPERNRVLQSYTGEGPSSASQDFSTDRMPESPRLPSREDVSPMSRKRKRSGRKPSTSDDLNSHIDPINSHRPSTLQSVVESNLPIIKIKSEPLDDRDHHKTENSLINNSNASAPENVMGPKIEPTGEPIEPMEPTGEPMEPIGEPIGPIGELFVQAGEPYISKTDFNNLEEMNNNDSTHALNANDSVENDMDMLRAGPSHDNSNCNMAWPKVWHGNRTNTVKLKAFSTFLECPNGCGYTCNVKSNYAEHLKTCCNNKYYTCLYCNVTFHFNEQLKKHLIMVHKCF